MKLDWFRQLDQVKHLIKPPGKDQEEEKARVLSIMSVQLANHNDGQIEKTMVSNRKPLGMQQCLTVVWAGEAKHSGGREQTMSGIITTAAMWRKGLLYRVGAFIFVFS